MVPLRQHGIGTSGRREPGLWLRAGSGPIACGLGWVHVWVSQHLASSHEGCVGCSGPSGWCPAGRRSSLEMCLPVGRRDAGAEGRAALSPLLPQSQQPLAGWQRAHVGAGVLHAPQHGHAQQWQMQRVLQVWWLTACEMHPGGK